MAEQTAIEWTDATFNPWIGCTKVSPACDHCYAEALMDFRHGRVEWGGERSRTAPATWAQPRRWQRAAEEFYALYGRRRRVFCASLADVFDNQVPEAWRADLWALIRDTPDLDWQLLTKRPQNIGKMLPAFWDEVKGHVWLGTTVEDQKRADINIPRLLEHDSAVRFVSCEPLLGMIDLDQWLHDSDCAEFRAGYGPVECICSGRVVREICLDWVICGGESGPDARIMHPGWVRFLQDQCFRAGVPFLFKQWGEWAWSPGDLNFSEAVAWGRRQFGNAPFEHHSCGLTAFKVGKKRAGRLLDEQTHNGFPEVRHG